MSSSIIDRSIAMIRMTNESKWMKLLFFHLKRVSWWWCHCLSFRHHILSTILFLNKNLVSINVYLTKKKIKKKRFLFLFYYLQNRNQETRLCGNERLKVDFFEGSSFEGTVGFVVVVDDDEVDDDVEDIEGGLIWLIGGDIDWINGDTGGGHTDNGIGVIGDGRDGIENGVIGDGIENGPCWEGENNW